MSFPVKLTLFSIPAIFPPENSSPPKPTSPHPECNMDFLFLSSPRRQEGKDPSLRPIFPADFPRFSVLVSHSVRALSGCGPKPLGGYSVFSAEISSRPSSARPQTVQPEGKVITFAAKHCAMNSKAKGYMLGIIAAASYGMNPLFALPLYQAGMDPNSVLFFRYLFAIPILGIMIKSRGRSFKLYRAEVVPLIVMGLLVALSSLTLFLSYNYMEAGIASTILFVYPIMVALIMAFVFKEKLTLRTVLCILLALAGIGLLYQGGNGTRLNLTGIGLVMASALSYAIYIVGVNQSTLKETATVKLTFYVLLFGLSLFLIRMAFGSELHTVEPWYLWGNLIALAVFPTAISFLCTTRAVQYIGSTPTAILGALEPVTAVFFGVVVFDESLTPRLLGGILLIILAVTLIIAGNDLPTYLIRFRKLFPKLPIKKRRVD